MSMKRVPKPIARGAAAADGAVVAAVVVVAVDQVAAAVADAGKQSAAKYLY